MWLFHPLGFASIVTNETDPATLVARSRFPGDLQKLFPGCRVRKTPSADYLYRTTVTREKVATRLAEMAMAIDYPNFKDTIQDMTRAATYGDVWEILYFAQERPNEKPEEDEAA